MVVPPCSVGHPKEAVQGIGAAPRTEKQSTDQFVDLAYVLSGSITPLVHALCGAFLKVKFSNTSSIPFL